MTGRSRPSGRVRTRPIWRVRLPKRCKGCAPQPPNRPVVVQRPTPCNFSTVCSGLGGLCGLCGAKAHTAGQLSPILARAKRERVVQDEVEKANRRPTDPTRHGTPHSLFKNLQFFTKICEIAAHSLFENKQFSTNICEIEAHSSFKS